VSITQVRQFPLLIATALEAPGTTERYFLDHRANETSEGRTALDAN